MSDSESVPLSRRTIAIYSQNCDDYRALKDVLGLRPDVPMALTAIEGLITPESSMRLEHDAGQIALTVHKKGASARVVGRSLADCLHQLFNLRFSP